MKVVETDRLILREFSLNDAPFILELVNDPSWLQFIGDRDVHTMAEARLYLQTGPLDSYQRFGFGLYLIRQKIEETPIGMCGFVKRPSLPAVDIGYALLPQFTGQGFAFEAATAVMAHGKTALGLKRLGRRQCIAMVNRLSGSSFDCARRAPRSLASSCWCRAAGPKALLAGFRTPTRSFTVSAGASTT